MSTTNPAGSWRWGSRGRCCSYGTFAREVVDLALGKSKFGQKIVGIGTERRRRRCRLRIAARQAKAGSHDLHRTIDGGHAVEALKQSTPDDLRMREPGRHLQDFPPRNPLL